MLSKTFLLHIDDPLRVVRGADDGPHLGLVENEVDLLLGHGIEKSNRCDLVVHVRDESRGPLGTVFHPDANEAPHFALSFDFGAQILNHGTLRESLRQPIDLLKALPCVVAKLHFAFSGLLGKLLACSKERSLRHFSDVSLEDFEQSVVLGILESLSVEVVVEFWLDLVTDKLGRVAFCGRFVCAELCVLNFAFDAVTSCRLCFNHSSVLRFCWEFNYN